MYILPMSLYVYGFPILAAAAFTRALRARLTK